MKALSLTQPYATLIAIGAKRIETRSWYISYRGPLAIHASKGLSPIGGKRGLNTLFCSPPFYETLWQEHAITFEDLLNVCGSVIATCVLKDCRSIEVPIKGRSWTNIENAINPDTLSDEEQAFGDYTPGRYGWLLDNIQILPEPIPAKGALSLWEWNK